MLLHALSGKIGSIVIGIAIVLWSAWAPAVDACTPAVVPEVPDSHTVSLNELLKAKSDVQSYIAGSENFLKCLDEQRLARYRAAEDVRDNGEKFLSERQVEEQIAENRVYNQIVDQMNIVADKFNQAVRAFKVRKDIELSRAEV